MRNAHKAARASTGRAMTQHVISSVLFHGGSASLRGLKSCECMRVEPGWIVQQKGRSGGRCSCLGIATTGATAIARRGHQPEVTSDPPDINSWKLIFWRTSKRVTPQLTMFWRTGIHQHGIGKLPIQSFIARSCCASRSLCSGGCSPAAKRFALNGKNECTHVAASIKTRSGVWPIPRDRQECLCHCEVTPAFLPVRVPLCGTRRVHYDAVRIDIRKCFSAP